MSIDKRSERTYRWSLTRFVAQEEEDSSELGGVTEAGDTVMLRGKLDWSGLEGRSGYAVDEHFLK